MPGQISMCMPSELNWLHDQKSVDRHICVVFVDYVHGYWLQGPRPASRRLLKPTRGWKRGYCLPRCMLTLHAWLLSPLCVCLHATHCFIVRMDLYKWLQYWLWIISLVVDDMAIVNWLWYIHYFTMHLACFGGMTPSIVTSKVALLAAQTYDC